MVQIRMDEGVDAIARTLKILRREYLRGLTLRTFMPALVCAALYLTLTGCNRQQPPAPVARGSEDVCAAFNASPREQQSPAVPNPKTQLDLIQTLDRQIRAADEARVPALLLELGRAKSVFRPAVRSAQASYAARRPEEFENNEVGGDWVYNGHDFQELIRRFPGHDLADDAAYELTLLPRKGECEGSIPCYIAGEWEPISKFLKAYPQSPLVGTAVDRALNAFYRVPPDKDLRVTTDFINSGELHQLVDSLDSVGRAIPPAYGGRLLLRAGELLTRYADYDRAAAAYRAASAGGDPPLERCAEARLKELPVQWFTLNQAHVINPRRVELSWQPQRTDVKAFDVYRSDDPSMQGNVVARLSGSALTWTDTGTEPGSTYWYRIVAETSRGRVESNPAAAETPKLILNVLGVAVSTKDHRLHVFGYLSNGFPQVLHVAADGSAVQRTNAGFIGLDNGSTRFQDGKYVDEVWLRDQGGRGVLRFRGNLAELPDDLFSAVRQGKEFLRSYAGLTQYGVRLIVSVDEVENVAWIAQGGGGVSLPITMDCIARRSICWLGGERNVQLRDNTGGVLKTLPLPAGAHQESRWATQIYADPKDGSAWVLLGRAARLLHVDANGTLRSDIPLTEESRSYSVSMTADLDHRAIWFTRSRSNKTELVRVDLDHEDLPFQVMVDSVPALPFLASDLDGGIWLVTLQGEVLRIDKNGRTLFSLALDAR